MASGIFFVILGIVATLACGYILWKHRDAGSEPNFEHRPPAIAGIVVGIIFIVGGITEIIFNIIEIIYC